MYQLPVARRGGLGPGGSVCVYVWLMDDLEHRTLEAVKASGLAAMSASERAEFDETYETEQRRLDDDAAAGSSEVDTSD